MSTPPVLSLRTSINVKMGALLLGIFLDIICEMCHGCNMHTYYDTSAANTVSRYDASKLHAFLVYTGHHGLKRNSHDHSQQKVHGPYRRRYRNKKERHFV